MVKIGEERGKIVEISKPKTEPKTVSKIVEISKPKTEPKTVSKTCVRLCQRLWKDCGELCRNIYHQRLA